MATEHNWLPHLKNAVPKRGYGNRLSTYLLSLEAWRRGLRVKFYTINNPENKLLLRFSISDGNEEFHFHSSLGDKLTNYAYDICKNKDETKKIISKAGVPVPEGKRFKENENVEDIIAYANNLGYPVVLKPVGEKAGRGVFSNIKTEKILRRSLDHVRNELNFKDIIIEKHIHGVEYRIFIVDGEIQGAVNRDPANIVGDGTSTIKQLIALKNKSKRNNPNISSKLINIDKEVIDLIENLGYSLESVPPKGKKIYLRNKSNVSMGGDPIDVTDQLTSELKDIAIRAVSAVKGLDICGLDMIVDKENNTGVVIEMNTRPMIGLHIYPVEGKSRDVVKPIIDYYFPETVNVKGTNLYFDFDAVLIPLKEKILNKIELLPPPSINKLVAKKFVFPSKMISSLDKKSVRRQALQENIYGYIKELSDGNTEVVLATEEKNKLDQFSKLCFDELIETQITDIKESEWTKPVKLGFEITSVPRSQKLIADLRKDLRSEKHSKERLLQQKDKEIIKNKKNVLKFEKQLKKIELDRLKVIEEKNSLQKEYLKILNSRSWKLTSPLRKLMKNLK